ncbi:MAG: chloride channel protein [Streptosporangiaceae bacterium]
MRGCWILVAGDPTGGISATFNAPITGVFFGVEIILREFSIDSLFTVMLSAMIADAVAIPFLGSRPFLSQFPAGIALHHPRTYLLVAVLAVVAALIGLLFKTVVYKIEDLWDVAWKNRPEWARPAIGGIALGLILLALPQMYGVGYPVMYKAIAGHYVLWFLLLLAAGKIIACSMTLGIGGSGGVFAPSLFIGVTSGMAFGEIAGHIFGPGAGQPALYAVVAMGAVFTSAARAPLTSLASVIELTGDFTLTLPVMLAVAIASTVSRMLSYGTIYTTKLLRRGIDVDQAAPWRTFGDLKVREAMQTLGTPLTMPDGNASEAKGKSPELTPLPGPVTREYDPQVLFSNESVAQALRQLEVYGHDGLPVLSPDGQQIEGWVTNASVLRSVARRIDASGQQAPEAQLAAEWALSDPQSALREPPSPLPGYQVLEITLPDDSPAAGQPLGGIAWPTGWIPVSVAHQRQLGTPDPGLVLSPGDRISLLVPSPLRPGAAQDGQAGGNLGLRPDRDPPPAGLKRT